MILNAEDASLGSQMQPVFAVDPISYLNAIEGFTTPTSLLLFSPPLFGVDAAKSFWRGAGKSSRITVSPPEGIRLNHDR